MKDSSTMIAQVSPSKAPVADKNSSVDVFANLFRRRQNAILLVKQLNQMIKSVQRHRGMSMGLLGGNQDFLEEFTKLQQQLTSRLHLFMAFASKTQGLITSKDLDNLRSALLTISHDWQDDSVIDNYELHCHLIEHLLALVATLAKHLEQPISSIMTNEFAQTNAIVKAYPNRLKQLEVLHFSTRLMPAVAEQIGRIRALATYAAALGECKPDHASKLQYVIQSSKINNEKLRHQAKRMETILEKNSTLLHPLKSYEIKLTFLLDMVEQDVLTENGKTSADSNRLFDIATSIIDMYLGIIDEGITLLDKWHQDELEGWFTPQE